jgi:hypothetical protein
VHDPSVSPPLITEPKEWITVTASSQNPPGALSSESPHIRPQLLQTAVAQAAPAPVSPVQVAVGVIRAAMAQGSGTAEDIAQAEQDAGIIFDPARAQDFWEAGYAQAQVEDKAELTQRGRQLAVMTDRVRTLETQLTEHSRRLDAVLRLCEGRPVSHHLPVSAILDAAAHASTPYDTAPMTLEWSGSDGVDLPEGGHRGGLAIVKCTSVHGGRADLVLTGDKRQALASLLDAEIVPDIHAPCPHSKACGQSDDEIDAAYPKLFGWARLFIPGLDEPGRWYCTPPCVFRALARASEKLATADHQAELDGGL